jgi:hypothetical protein
MRSAVVHDAAQEGVVGLRLRLIDLLPHLTGVV